MVYKDSPHSHHQSSPEEDSSHSQNRVYNHLHGCLQLKVSTVDCILQQFNDGHASYFMDPKYPASLPLTADSHLPTARGGMDGI